jgi:hypothetical protein
MDQVCSNISVCKPEGKRPLDKSSDRCEDNIKVEVKVIVYSPVDYVIEGRSR